MDESTMTADKTDRGVDGRWMIVLFAIAAIGVVAYFALGMPGMDHGGGDMATMSGMQPSEMAVGADEFARRIEANDAFVVNVHVPDEGTIDGTDATIRYDRIASDRRLPVDKGTRILLYCRTDRMSQDAAVELMDAGYTNVVYLEGGMDAWAATGRILL